MNKTDLVNAIMDKMDANKADATRFLDAMVTVFTDALQRGDSVQLPGFGTLAPAERAARVGMNPRTKEPIDIPASKNVKFKVAAALKKALNEGSEAVAG